MLYVNSNQGILKNILFLMLLAVFISCNEQGNDAGSSNMDTAAGVVTTPPHDTSAVVTPPPTNDSNVVNPDSAGTSR